MNQPSQIPAFVQRYVDLRLNGKGGAKPEVAEVGTFVDPLRLIVLSPDGLYRRLETSEREFADCLEQLEQMFPKCEHGYFTAAPDERDVLEAFRQDLMEAAFAVDYCKQEIALLKKFIDPEAMGDAYAALASEFTKDEDWFRFLEAARNAQQDYAEYRRVGKEATRLLAQVSEAANELGSLLRKLQATQIKLPPELQSDVVPEEEDMMTLSPFKPEANRLKLDRFLERFFGRKAAGKNPAPKIDLASTLFTAAKLAKDVRVEFDAPEVDAATTTRQDSQKTAYIRAFGALLEQASIPISPGVVRAMATTVNVMLDDPDLSTSEDTVRKALKRSLRKAPNA